MGDIGDPGLGERQHVLHLAELLGRIILELDPAGSAFRDLVMNHLVTFTLM